MDIKKALEKKIQANPFQSLSAALYEILLNMIVRFHLPPHAMISVKKIADTCQISKTPVKNAVDWLEKEGFVYKIKNKGAFVAPFDYADYANGHHLRTALEIAAAKKAGLLMEETDHAQLHRAAKEIEQAYAQKDIAKIYALEQNFHFAIVAHARNPHMIEAYKELLVRLHRLNFYLEIDPNTIKDLNEQHFEICDALKSGDDKLIQSAVDRHRKLFPIDYKKAMRGDEQEQKTIHEANESKTENVASKKSAKEKEIKENKQKLSDDICDMLIEDITSLRLKPDTRLNMTQLAEEMGVSITPVREAITKLQKLGLVDTKYHKQATVGICDYNDYVKLQEFRMLLEAEAAKHAAQKMSEEDHRHLQDLAQKLEEAYRRNARKKDSEKVVVTQEDIDFHSFVILCSHNPYIIEQYRKIKPKLLFFRQYAAINEKTISVPQEHFVLCYALKTRDAAFAAEAFLHHGQASEFGKSEHEKAEKRRNIS